MLKIKFSGKFAKMYDELLKDEPELEDLVDELRAVFVKNPKDTRLRNHSLSGKMAGQFAFSINDDIRIVYEVIGKNTVRFLAIGPHEKVYP
jgi:addiction module RelE/StbE family toxin